MQESCGVFGIVEKRERQRNFKIHHGLGQVDKAYSDTALKRMGKLAFQIFFALKGLQHRGQDSSGMAVCCNAGIGHNRYSTTGGVNKKNIQPIQGSFRGIPFALAHNGNLTNTLELKKIVEDCGAVFEEGVSDTRIIVKLIEISIKQDFLEALEDSLLKLRGAFSLVILYRDKVIAAKDSFGVRPLCFGENEQYYAVSSESCSLDHLNIQLLREVKPGELIIIDRYGIQSKSWILQTKKKICLFEYIYFARPDSVIDGVPVHRARRKMGCYLACEHSPKILSGQAIVPALDSGLLAALGFRDCTNILLVYEALFRAHFTFGRTFIASTQDSREFGVSLKFNPVLFDIENKRVILIDDSIVRGTTAPRLVKLLKTPKKLMGKIYQGAKEVYMLVTAPPYLYPCYYGIDTWRYEGELIAGQCKGDIEKVREKIGADYLGYLSLESTIKAVVESDLTGKLKPCDFCTACFTGNYPIKS
ncbi:MAG: amidophosphoribosyltransferase [Candidatus Nealsonbacteria bacterium]|nr:amidophosphoribosyltransferase [Candidatus Nealsonbacteria bacterium]